MPKMPVRGIYLATHFHNYYQDAPVEDVARYVEDLSLWGVNSVLVWFGLEAFNGINDPEAQVRSCASAHLVEVGKGPWSGRKPRLRRQRGVQKLSTRTARDHDWGGPGHGAMSQQTGRPGTGSKILQGEVRCVQGYWPGLLVHCAVRQRRMRLLEMCALGRQWLPALAEPEARAYRRAFPKGKVVLSTWDFDLLFGRGEWAGLTEKFNKQKPDWVDYIMADEGIRACLSSISLGKGRAGRLSTLEFS